jgi:phenylpropionate dioxygenase-like ring-hydroxylating dioxygenase large terminal subunit
MLNSYWYIACESRELTNKPLATILMEKPLVLFRAASGKIGAIEDRCAHRNAPLSRGKIVNNCLECPYHGWQYGTDGKATEIPAFPEGHPIPSNLFVQSYHAVETDGYIWVCLAEEPATEKPLPFPYLGEKGWTTFRMKTRFNGSVETCLENFLDCPHATFVHRLWFRTPSNKKVKAIVTSLSDGAVAEYLEEPRNNAVVWRLLSREKSELKHTDRFIAPATSRVDYIFSDRRHYIITSSCTPIDETTTEVYTVISFKYPVFGWLIRLFFAPLSRWIITQDVRIIELQQTNIKRFGKAVYKYVPQDLLLPYIRKWRQAMNTGIEPPKAGEKHEVEMRL